MIKSPHLRYKEADLMIFFLRQVNKSHLAHPVVCKFDVSFRVQKHIVQF